MPMSDGERKETIANIREAEKLLQNHKQAPDPDLYHVFCHILNVLKRLCGDQTPLVE